jgi:threonine aldolase
MRKAMAEAEVGDDVYGEDPTVRRLEEEAAALLGFESALFVPSGMMGNQIGLRLLVPRGSELLVDARAHVVRFEQGALASIGGIQTRTLETADGWPTVEALEAAFHPPSAYGVATGGLALENTHNLAGGRVLPPERGRLLLEWARKRGIPVHLDGARLWNAAVALDLPPAALAQGFDTVMVCLSKGLAAPVGSLLVSSCERIREARRLRRELGGGMRQAGVLAAAGLVALREGMSWLAADHRRARRLAEALANLQGIEIDPTAVETNIGIFRVQLPGRNSAQELVSAFAARGVWMAALDGSSVRFVTHRDIDDRALEQAIRIVTEVVHEVTNASRGFSR